MYKLLACPTKIKREDCGMVAHIKTVALLGGNTVSVDVKAHLVPGHSALTVAGLPDKSVAESRELARAA